MSNHQLTKTCNQMCLANPTDKYACQLDLLGRVDYTAFVSRCSDVCSNPAQANQTPLPSLINPAQAKQANLPAK